MFDFGIVYDSFPRFGNIEILSKVFLANTIFIATFTVSYLAVSFGYRNAFGAPLHNIHISRLWIWLACVFVLFDILFKYATGMFELNPWTQGGTQALSRGLRSMGLFRGQIYSKIVLLENLLFIFGIGTIVARSSTVRVARVRLIFILCCMFPVFYFFTTERGFILVIGIGAAAYADMVRWKGNLLNRRLVLIGIIGVFLLNLTTTIIESVVIYGNIWWRDKLTVANSFMLGGGVTPLWITSMIISWIDNLEMPLQYGLHYLNAIKSFLPSQLHDESIGTLTRWFIREVSPLSAESGTAWGFSAVAEGYMNGRMLGVAIHGLIIGLLGGLIRYFQVSGKFGIYAVFFYSALLSRFWKIYNEDSIPILSGFQWGIIGTIFLIYLTSLLLGVVKRKG
jgi:hypothetical protein